MKSPLLQHDNLDTRREVYLLFDSLTPTQRLTFLRWACRHATGAKMQPGISPGHTGGVLECVLDWWGLISQYGLDADFALKGLEAFVRKASRF